MKAVRDRLFLSAHWHVDCRLVAELPEDSVVGIRFITYAVSCGIALAVVLFTGWYAYTDFNLRHQIDYATNRLEDDRWEVIEITRLQRFYEIESKKIESAYSEMKTPLLISGFISELGRTLPERMVVDAIDYGDGTFVIDQGVNIVARLHEVDRFGSDGHGADRFRAERGIGLLEQGRQHGCTGPRQPGIVR